MTIEEAGRNLELSRRKLLAAAGMGAGALVAASFDGIGGAQAASIPGKAPGPAATPTVAGLHLQFGADASSEVTVSWHALQPVHNPRVVLGRPDGKFERTVDAKPTSYTDGKSKQVVYAYHAKIGGLQADVEYMYGAVHDGAAPEFGTFRTSPRGRAAFTFTSFGDQGTPTTGKKFVPPAGITLPAAVFVNDNLGSPAGGDTTLGVERLRPLFHLFNGDLCYANLAEDRVRTWWDFWANNTRSARNRPWMPSPGNHENELGNGPIGYQAYQTYFSRARRGGPNRCDARTLVCLYRRFGAGDQYRQRRHHVSGRRQLLRAGLLVRSAENLAGTGTGSHPGESRHRLGRGVHAPGRHLDGRQIQWRRPRNPRGMGAAVRQI